MSEFDSILRLFIWFDESLNMKVYRRSAMDFGGSQASLALSIAQIKFIAPLLSYLMSLIIVVFCRFADNYSSSVQTATEYKLVAKDLKEAHETLSIPLKFICSSERYEKNNEVETNVPLLGLLWNRNDDSISFNGTFSLSKKK